MIETKDFKTKSEIIELSFPSILGNNQYKGKSIAAVDWGYSSVKGISSKRAFSFPSYAKQIPGEIETIGAAGAYDIQLRFNDTGEMWAVGDAAEGLMTQVDIDSTTDASLYNRFRYDSPVFHALIASGLALALWGTGDNEIFLQTGLPATYKERDEARLKNAIIGDYDISIKIGNNPWMPFKFTMDADHVDIMEQPMGTLSGCIYKDGMPTEIGKTLIQSRGTLVYDVGFGTEDDFSVKAGKKGAHKTYTDVGMRAVFEETIKELASSDLEVDIKVFELQKYLESGEIPVFSPEDFGNVQVKFADILEKKNRELCEKSIRRLADEYDHFKDFQYLIVTGGTNASRYEQIVDLLKNFKNLTVINGNINYPNLSVVYSNVIGYYMARYAKLKKALSKTS